MTFQISLLAWPSYGWITLGSAHSMPSVARRVDRTEASGLGGSSEASYRPMTYSSTSNRLLNISEPVSNSPMLLSGSSSESLLLWGGGGVHDAMNRCPDWACAALGGQEA